jgi:hypothetical protein
MQLHGFRGRESEENSAERISCLSYGVPCIQSRYIIPTSGENAPAEALLCAEANQKDCDVGRHLLDNSTAGAFTTARICSYYGVVCFNGLYPSFMSDCALHGTCGSTPRPEGIRDSRNLNQLERCLEGDPTDAEISCCFNFPVH